MPRAKPGVRRRGKRKPPANKGLRLPSERLSVDELHKLLRACSRRSGSGIRLAAMIAVGWRAGLRAAELLALRPADVDPDRGLVTVRNGKGGKARTVGVGPDALPYVDRWLDYRARLDGVPAGAPPFCGIRGAGRGLPGAY